MTVSKITFIDAGLVDIHSIDGSIKVDLVNSDPDKNYLCMIK